MPPLLVDHRALLAALIIFCAPLAGAVLAPLASAAPAPNVIVILTDDQSIDTMQHMPIVQNELVAKGTNFTNAVVANSYCCPSRTTSLTGNYSHTTEIYQNGWDAKRRLFNDSSTIATWMQSNGYRTGMFGKYLNGMRQTYVAPGWDVWRAQWRGSYYGGYVVNERRKIKRIPTTQYLNRYMTGQLTRFIRTTPARQPLFAWFSTYGPHAPAVPEQKYLGAFADEPDFTPTGFNEADVSDKPSWVRAKTPLSASTITSTTIRRRRQLEVLQSIDESVGTILTTLEAAGRLNNTMVVFTSDNGYMHGQHRMIGKRYPYSPSVQVPLVIRFDGTGTGSRTVDAMVSNVDLAPTIADFASITTPKTDGTSFRDLYLGNSPAWRTYAFIEHAQGNGIPSYCSARSATRQYIQYSTREEELYDLALDPGQLNNLAANPAYAAELTQHRVLTRELCRPVPPDYMDEPSLVRGDMPVRTNGSVINPDWGGTDTGRGTSGYSVRIRRANFGQRAKPWSMVQSNNPTTTRPLTMAPGQTLCVAARAHDVLGNKSSWTPPQCTTRMRSAAVLKPRTKGWVRTKAKSRAQTSTLLTRRRGAVATTGRIRARSVWISARHCRKCGTVEVRWNGRRVRRLSLRSKSSKVRVRKITSFKQLKRGKLTLHVLTPGRRVQIVGIGSSHVPR